MKINIRAQLDYSFDGPTDILLQVEAAHLPEQAVERAHIAISHNLHFARVPAQDLIGERIWMRVDGGITVDYTATVAINRILNDCLELPMVPPHLLPGETVQYLMPSRYCPSDQFHSFVAAEFGAWEGGRKVMAMADWVNGHLSYVPGSSAADTTAADTFIRREGVCRDYAHVLVTMVRAAGIPARVASVYALGVEPQDFHAVADVFLGGEWHMIDATRMATEADMVKISVGRDAADVAFMTAYGNAILNQLSVEVSRG